MTSEDGWKIGREVTQKTGKPEDGKESRVGYRRLIRSTKRIQVFGGEDRMLGFRSAQPNLHTAMNIALRWSARMTGTGYYKHVAPPERKEIYYRDLL